ncbi:MAG: TIGR03668 family PPOX class F420-dependent oxidoreductase [Acidimicrobiia bacterium]|nr:TIGR03668 family PPOX class F420-dependent oxidoreductase [Acidimicrobiia bacterium]
MSLARQARIGRLGTRSASGGIDLVPFVFAALDGPGPLGRLVCAVDHKPKRHGRLRRLDNVAAHPEVTVLVDHYEEEWDRLWWVRLRGTGRQAMGDAERAEAIAALVAKYGQYRERPPVGAVLVIELTAVRGWSA